MLVRYSEFLKEFDNFLSKLFESQKEYICCKKGCSFCCEQGDYPFSRLEAEYIMAGFVKLPVKIQLKIKENIKDIKGKKSYKCPFLIDKECCMYERRGIVCRTHGLAYLKDNIVKLPECANIGLNYGKVFDSKTKEILINNPISTSLRTDDLFKSHMAQKYNLQCGEIRRLSDWL